MAKAKKEKIEKVLPKSKLNVYIDTVLYKQARIKSIVEDVGWQDAIEIGLKLYLDYDVKSGKLNKQ